METKGLSVVEIRPNDREDLRRAKALLEKPSLAVRLSHSLGSPIETGLQMLPENWVEIVQEAVQRALEKALEIAIHSLHRKERGARPGLHRAAVIASGATGGMFGLAGLVMELPVSTTLMLRSIAEIAREEGEDLLTPAGRLACLEVFAFGGPTRSDDAAETGYLAVRAALASSVTEAARYLAERGMAETTAPALLRFISAVGARFGIVVSEKVAAMAVPAIGAAGGALINSIFISHFQDMARGHFLVRRLERQYGAETVRSEYLRLAV